MEFDIIERIKAVKQSKKITNEDLSESSGIPLGTLNKLLSGGVAEPRFSAVMAICSALGCRISDMLGEDAGETLPKDDISVKFAALDDHGKALVTLVMDKELERCRPAMPVVKSRPVVSHRAIILPLFELPVSAGTGAVLDGDASEDIRIEFSPKTKDADFALRISGNSMMPKYSDGDVILVDSHARPDIGELGVFVCDGEGFFKKFGGDRLISLNPDYSDILLDGFSSVDCRGRVIGRLR